MNNQTIRELDEAIRLNPKDAVVYLNRGDAYCERGDYDKAIVDYDEAIRLDPENTTAYGSRSFVYYERGDYDKAIADCDKAIQLDPENATAYNNRGNAYQQKDECDKAIVDYDKAIELDPEDTTAYSNRGNAYRQKGDYDKAIVDYDEAIQLDPENATAYNNRSFVYYERGDYDKAIADCDKAIRLAPEDAIAYLNRGFAYHEKGEYDRAIADYDKAIKLDLENVYLEDAINGLEAAELSAYLEDAILEDAIAYNNRQKGEYDKVIVDCDKAIELDPENITAYLKRGLAYSKKGEYDKAITDYDEVIRLDSEDAIAYLNRGFAYHEKGEYYKAQADTAQAIRLNPEDAITYFNRVSTYLADCDAYKAYLDYEDRITASADEVWDNLMIENYTDAIHLDPKNPDPYSDRGDSYFLKDDWDSAISDYTEAIRLAPEDARAYNKRGNTYYQKGDYDKAIEEYDVAIRLTPEDDLANIREKRGDAYYQKGDYDKAIEDYNEVIRIDPGDASADIMEKRGDAYYQKGDYNKAIEDYSEVIRIDPGDAMSADAKLQNAYSAKLNIIPKYEVCNEAIRDNRKVVTAYHDKGYAYYREGEYEQAIVNYNEALQFDPENAKIYIDRGNAYLKKCDIDLDLADSSEVIRAKNDIDMAIVDYNEAIGCSPEEVIAYFNRGRAYIKKSDIELAAAAYSEIVTTDELNEAIRRNPKNATVYFRRGYIYFKQGNVNQAIEDYENAVLCPNYEADFVDAGFADGGEYAFEKAIELLDRVISSPSVESAADCYYLGLQSLFCLDTSDADECFAEALTRGYHDRSRIERHLENIPKLKSQRERYQSWNGSKRRERYQSWNGSKRRKQLGYWISIEEENIHKRRERREITNKRRERREVMQGHHRRVSPEEQRWKLWARGPEWRRVSPEERHQYKLTIANYNETIQQNPEDADTYSKRGYAHFQRREYDSAIADYNKVIQLNPKDVTAYFNRSSAYQQKGFIDLHRSGGGTKLDIALCDESIRFDPENAEAYFNRANAYFGTFQNYDSFKDKESDSVLLDYDRHNAYDHLASAIVDYNKALCLLSSEDPMFYWCHWYRARAYHTIADKIYYEIAQYDEAIEAYRIPSGDTKDKQHEIAQYDEVIEAYSKAITDYDAADRSRGDHSFTDGASLLIKAYFCRGKIYAEKGNYDLAIADMNRIIINDQKTAEQELAEGGRELSLLDDIFGGATGGYFGSSISARAYSNKGFYHYKIREYDKAIEDLREAINIYIEQLSASRSDPDFAIMYLNLGGIYHAKGDVESAIKSYDNVVRICPNYVKDFVNSNFAHGGEEESDEAVKLLDKIVDDYCDTGNFAAAAYYSGVSILFSGNPHIAQENFETARDLGFDESGKLTKHLENLKS